MSVQGKLKVVVTGAGGRTGELVVKKLLASPDQFEVRATVRGQKSADKLAAAGVAKEALFTVDITDVGSAAQQLAAAFEGQDAVVIATSGVPQIQWLSLLPVFLAKLTGKQGVRPEFTWKAGQTPEQVDWLGQKVQIDAAKAAGISQVVLISSMGGTDPENMLNKLGNGNILQWKRRAEQYLVESGLPYTIIHPGGLVDEAAGVRQVVLGIDDTLLKRTVRSIPRADVAELAVRCLGLAPALNRSFDAITLPAGEGQPVSDWAALLSELEGNCDYSINSQLPAGAAAAVSVSQ